MLVLTRKLGEAIYIDNDIKVTLVRIDQGQVRIGIQAPRDVIVMREELRDTPLATASAPDGGVVQTSTGRRGASGVVLTESDYCPLADVV
jgi:carbon storage regulator CsrA